MWPTSLTVPQRGTRRGNMAYSTLGMLLGLLCASAHDLTGIPRTSWERQEASLLEFSEPGISNYSTLLLREDRGVLYVGAKEAIFELHMRNISVKNNMVMWEVPERHMLTCTSKGKTKETDCLNYIRVVEEVSNDRLYVCGTHAFQPLCDYLSLKDFVLEGNQEDGRGKCPFDPAQSFASVMVDGELYSGTVNNFLGSEPIISKSSLSQSMLRTEYSTSWLNEPSFVLADIVRVSEGDEDDEVYYFFTEVSVEYEFFGKLLIPRIARVCKGDLGGLRTLQKKWTSFLKAKLVCSMPETNFVFNVVHDVFILKTANRGETLVYGVFSSQWGNVGSSAVCSYSMSAVDQVFSSGKYMQKASVEQLHTKWVRYNGVPPSPRPGACIDSQDRLQNISSSLNLPDKTLQFVKDHPLLEDPVLPVGNRPKFMTKDVRYTQIAVERVLALDNKQYDVIFTGTDKGVLHKSVVYEDGVHIIEEIQLLPDSESIKTLILSSHGLGFLYAASDSSVVQAPTARCGGYPSCQSCILARDPYCAWDPEGGGCARLPREQDIAPGNLLQSLNGDAEKCPQAGKTTSEGYRRVSVRLGHSAELPCRLGSSSARAVWKVNGGPLSETSPAHRQSKAGLLVHAVSPNHGGHYECWALERTGAKDSSWLVQGYVLSVDPADGLLTPDTSSTTGTRPTTIPPSESAVTPTALDKAPAEHLRSEGNSAQLILLILVILLILLLLAGVSYNCYMLYLPDPCLRARAGLLGRPKQPQPEYAACEAGLMERATDKPSCANGARPKAPPDAAQEAGPEPEPGKSSAKDTDSPFDVVCDSQPIEFVDVDAPC